MEDQITGTQVLIMVLSVIALTVLAMKLWVEIQDERAAAAYFENISNMDAADLEVIAIGLQFPGNCAENDAVRDHVLRLIDNELMRRKLVSGSTNLS